MSSTRAAKISWMVVVVVMAGWCSVASSQELPEVEPVEPYDRVDPEPPYTVLPADNCMPPEPEVLRARLVPMSNRISTVLTPDLGRLQRSVWASEADELALVVDVSGELRAFSDAGLLREEGTWTEGSVSAGGAVALWGWVVVAAQSELILPMVVDGPEGAWLRGAHRVDARVVLGEPRDEDLVLVIEGGWSLRHVGDRRPAALPTLVGPARVEDEEVRLGVWPGFGDDDTQAVSPIRYAYRQLRYEGAAGTLPVARVEQHRVSSGFGGRFSDAHDVPQGYMELVGVAYTQTRFNGGTGPVCSGRGPQACALEQGLACAGCRTPVAGRKIEQIDLNIMSLEDLVVLDSELFGALNLRMGATWLWDAARDREEAFAVMGFGVDLASEGIVGRLDLLRQGTVTADGGQFVSEFRAEAQLVVEPEELPGGVSVSGAVSLYGDPAQTGDEVTLAARAGIATEWYWRPARWLRAGFFHTAQVEPRPGPAMWDPWAEARWGHELGVFVRADESLGR